jgi:pimeloyl-ACP methyl ester carboxylesterase
MPGRSRSDALIIVLHGDNRRPPPTYSFMFAEQTAGQLGCRTVALLRPGYSDGADLRSAGFSGQGYGDNYDHFSANRIGDAVRALQSIYRPSTTLLVGHSGGAALAVAMMALHPSLIDAAVLVACPYDLDGWRRHMALRQLNPYWLLPSESVSPLRVVDNLAKQLRITCLSGGRDPLVRPAHAAAFFRAARRAGLDVRLNVVQDAGHDMLEHPAVLDSIAAYLGVTAELS